MNATLTIDTDFEQELRQREREKKRSLGLSLSRLHLVGPKRLLENELEPPSELTALACS